MTTYFSRDISRATPTLPEEEGSFQIALNDWEKRTVRALIRGAGVEQNIRSTLRGLAGEGFSAAELADLEARVFEEATMGDVKTLWGIEAGAPVFISPRQKAAVDGLFGRLGDDPLARRAREAYGRALQKGRVKVR